MVDTLCNFVAYYVLCFAAKTQFLIAQSPIKEDLKIHFLL